MTEVMDDVAGQSPNQSRLTVWSIPDSPTADLLSAAIRASVSSLALGPGRRSEFFDPKVRVMPRPY